MMQDAKNISGFTTENGVARYDGYEFKVFTARDGLPIISHIETVSGFYWQGSGFYLYSGNI
ncbi:MAG: hypothetical protein R2764_01055 [Bacteroidales bacterium]